MIGTRVNVQQRTKEWHDLRLGRITASKVVNIIYKGNKPTESYKSYLAEKLAEIIKGSPKKFEPSWPMIRGTELECSAIFCYENELGLKVTDGGFYIYEDYLASSPDGIVNKDLIIEVKCKNETNHAKFILEKKVPGDHMAQMQLNMLMTGAKECDYVLYHPDFKSKRLLVERVSACPETHELILKRAKQFKQQLDEQR